MRRASSLAYSAARPPNGHAQQGERSAAHPTPRLELARMNSSSARPILYIDDGRDWHAKEFGCLAESDD